MPSFFTGLGDDGTTGLLGKGRVPKYDLRVEALGTLDEATAAIGLGRAFCLLPESRALLLKIQRDLYQLMSEVAATPENVEKFRVINPSYIAWLEEQTSVLGQVITTPGEFILPGDTQVGAALDLARTVVRRAERRLAELLQRGDITNYDLLGYLNRLSSFLFVLELQENQMAGKAKPTLAKI